jgi:ADP-heptose:LPS heptosyltransferase
VLVLRPGALGDTLLAVPALRALRRAFGSVTLAAHAGAARLLAACGEIDRGMPFDDPSLTRVFSGRGVPAEDVVAWMSSAPGLSSALVAPSRPQGVEHCARYLLRSLAPLGIDLTWDDSPLRIGAVASHEVLVHVGSGSPAKNWPAKRFAAFIRALDAPVRLIVGEADSEPARAVERNYGAALPRLAADLSLLAQHLAGCRAYVGNDSGVSHLAGLCGARTFALFGPTDPAVWRPIGPNIHVVGFDTDPETLASEVSA